MNKNTICWLLYAVKPHPLQDVSIHLLLILAQTRALKCNVKITICGCSLHHNMCRWGSSAAAQKVSFLSITLCDTLTERQTPGGIRNIAKSKQQMKMQAPNPEQSARLADEAAHVSSIGGTRRHQHIAWLQVAASAHRPSGIQRIYCCANQQHGVMRAHRCIRPRCRMRVVNTWLHCRAHIGSTWLNCI